MFDLSHLGTRFSNANYTFTTVVTGLFLRAHYGSFIVPDRIDQGVEMLRYHTGNAPCTEALLKVYFEILRCSRSVCRPPAHKRLPLLARELPGREWCS